jgi:hypothetical protein
MITRLLLDEPPLQLLPTLAVTLGLHEAIVLQQFHFWIEVNKRKNVNLRDGKIWTYGSYVTWQKENFPFLSVGMVRRAIEFLEKNGIVIRGCYNSNSYDHTSWYSINYEKLDEFLEKHSPFVTHDKSVCYEQQKDATMGDKSFKESHKKTLKENASKNQDAPIPENQPTPISGNGHKDSSASKGSTAAPAPPDKKGDILDGMLRFHKQTFYERVRDAIKENFKIDIRGRNNTERAFLEWAVVQGEDFFPHLDIFSRWWYTVDWRGSGKGSPPPTMNQIQTLWPQAENEFSVSPYQDMTGCGQSSINT